MPRKDWLAAAPSLLAAHLAGACAGAAAWAAGAPLPWLLGGLFGSAALVTALPGGIRGPWRPSAFLRDVFVVVIGVMIGGAFRPELLDSVAAWGPSLAGLVVFSLSAQAAIYALHRRLGMDRPTAWFAASPGGLFESILLGEAAGGDVRRITLLQFGRIVCVVTLLPVLYSLWAGHAVGSSAGAASGQPPLTWQDATILAVAGAAGWAAATVVRFPAAVIIGPLAFSAAAHAAGLTEGQVPPALSALAQLMVGVGLGLRFGALGRREIGGALALSLGSVLITLSLALLVALAASRWSAEGVEVLLLSYAPGGIIEMGLIALTLGANPVFVTAHHILRVVLTVTVTPQLYRLLATTAEDGGR